MPLIEDQFEDSLLIARYDVHAVLFVALEGRYQLPVVHTVGHHPAEVGPTRRAVRDQFGLEAIVLGCRTVSVADGIVHRLLELEMLDDRSTRSDLRWVRESDCNHLVLMDSAHAAAVDEWCHQRAKPADGREWTLPGWWTHATSWIAENLEAAGFGPPRAMEQVRSWEFSCVVRVKTEQGNFYFKALPDSYASEPALVQHLAHWEHPFVPDVVATNAHARWLLMRDSHGRCLESGAPLASWERVAGAYAELQVESTAHVPTLRALGCPERGPPELRSSLGALVADNAALLQGTEHGLTGEEVSRLRHLRSRLEAACDELALSGLPFALEHGDLWDSNVYVAVDRVTFIDWTDASLAHPFFSLMPLLVSATWDPILSTVPDAQQRIVDAYLEHWTAYAAPERLRRVLAIARPLAALHIAVTYWRDIPQPHKQWWMQRMVPFFVRLALAEWDKL